VSEQFLNGTSAHYRLFSATNGSMGVGTGLYMYDVVVKKIHVRYLIS